MAYKKKGVWDIDIVINGKKVKNTLNGIGAEVGKLNRDLKKLTPGTEEFIKKSEELKKAREHYQSIKDEINGTNISLQEAKGHWNDLFDGILSGDFDAVSSGLKGITGNIKGMAKAAWAFIATPIGAAIATLIGVAAATKEWANYNEEAAKANLTVNSITSLVGKELDAVRVKAQALTEIFGKSTFEENIETARSLVKGFGISYKEAFDLIEDSYVRGATANDEFNDSIVEFSAIQKKAGFTAKETVALINNAYSEDLYKDKFIDAIHEVDTALTEQSKSAKEALTGAFGDKFTSSLFKKVKSGAISTKDAIALISKQASTASLDQQQYAKLTADIFKSAGEDIGGAKKVLEVFNKALNEQAKALTPVQLETKRLSDAHLELKQAQDEALKSDDYAKFSNDVTIVWTKTKTFFYKSVGAVVSYFQDWFLTQKLGFSDMMISFKAIPMRFDETKKILITAVGNILDAFKHLGNAWESLKNLDLKGVRAEVGNFNSSIKDAATGASDAYDKIGKKIDEVSKKARNKIIKEHFDSKTGAGEIKNSEDIVTPVVTNLNTKKTTITQKSLDKEKELLKERNKIFDNGEKELNTIIAKQKKSRLLASKTGIDKELLAVDQKYATLKERFILSEADKTNLTLAQKTEREAKIKELDEFQRIEKEELQIANDAIFKERLKLIEDENRIEEETQKFDRDALAAETEEQRIQILLDKTRWIADEEIKIAEAAALKKAKLAGATEAEIAAIKKKFGLEKTKVETTFQKEKTKADKQASTQEKATLKERMQAYGAMFGNIAQLLGEHTAAGKAAAIAQATINTWQGVTEVWKAPAVLPEPFNTASKVLATATTVSSGLKAVGVIKKTDTKGYFEGGHTGSKALYHDGQDGVTGPVHVGEWVAPKWMNDNPRYAPTIQFLEQERIKGPGYFDGGHVAPPTSSGTDYDEPDESETFVNNDSPMLLEQLTRLNNHLDSGIISYALIGDDEIQTLKERTKKINTSRENAKIQ
ncbi:phage tail tape measure protein [Tenacibaculum piscium]|uniref:hypothetical protein n=1 Tax=Tenacibaculum piscium TaxID=1458515 RepID=UPI001F246FC9|nr:hypothetical protein [Tenacibaculum piscium]